MMEHIFNKLRLIGLDGIQVGEDCVLVVDGVEGKLAAGIKEVTLTNGKAKVYVSKQEEMDVKDIDLYSFIWYEQNNILLLNEYNHLEIRYIYANGIYDVTDMIKLMKGTDDTWVAGVIYDRDMNIFGINVSDGDAMKQYVMDIDGYFYELDMSKVRIKFGSNVDKIVFWFSEMVNNLFRCIVNTEDGFLKLYIKKDCGLGEVEVIEKKGAFKRIGRIKKGKGLVC